MAARPGPHMEVLPDGPPEGLTWFGHVQFRRDMMGLNHIRIRESVPALANKRQALRGTKGPYFDVFQA